MSHGRPYHPQTQGKDERFHRSLKEEVLSRCTLVDLADAQRRLDAGRTVYNCDRPHEALGLQPPRIRYRCSPREYPQELPALTYPSHQETRTVSSRGVIHYRGQSYHVSRGFCGLTLGLESASAGAIGVWFGPQRVGHLDPSSGVFVRARRANDAVEAAGDSPSSSV